MGRRNIFRPFTAYRKNAETIALRAKIPVRFGRWHVERSFRDRIRHPVACVFVLKNKFHNELFVPGLCQETRKDFAPARLLQFLYGLRLDLSDAFPGYMEYPADFFQCVRISVFQAVS